MPGDDAPGPGLASAQTGRTPLIAGTVIAVASVVLALLSWSGRVNDLVAAAPESGELHELTVDQAACLQFAIILDRSEAQAVSPDLGRRRTLDPLAGKRVADEIVALDDLGRDFPAADYRLIRTLSATADASARVLASIGKVTFRSAATGRSRTIAESADACRELADFDVETKAAG